MNALRWLVLAPLLGSLLGCSADPPPLKPGSHDGGTTTNGGGGGGGSSAGGGGGSSAGGGGSSSAVDLAIAPGAPGDGGAACIIGQSGALGLIPGATMAPGAACITCHIATNAGALHVAGTVYTAMHEPDGCLGVVDSQVIVTDAQGAAHTLAVNSSGNFVDGTLFGFSTPMQVAVSRAGQTVKMIGSVTNGDCNSCHTAAGANSAPGRIVAP